MVARAVREQGVIGITGAMAALAIGVALLVVSITLVLERRRCHPRPVPVPRQVATVAWVGALLVLILQPGSMRWIDARRAWVATEGAAVAAATSAMVDVANSFSAMSAFRLTSDRFVAVTEDDSTGAESGTEAEIWADRLPGIDRVVPVVDPGALVRGHPSVTRWGVVGEGLPPWTRMPPSGPRIEVFVSAPFAPGVRRVAWTRQRVLGQPVVVEGVLTSTVPRPGVLRLLDDGGIADTWPVLGDTDVNGGGVSSNVGLDLPFVLEAVPRTEGRHRLRLQYVAEDAAAPVFEETLDVAVSRPEGLDVLWWSAAPSFEIRPLRDWLVTQGGSMVSRTGLTGTRHRVGLAGPEAERLSEPGLDRLSTALLAGFDIVVLDVETVSRLRSDERVALRTAVEDDGLGVLIRWAAGDELPSRDRPSELLPLVPTLTPVADLESLSARVSWPGTTLDLSLTLAPRQLARDAGVAPLVQDASDRLLAGARVLGRGTVGWSLVDGTYRWALAGRPELHRAFWSRVFGHLARPERALRWLPPSKPVLVDHPTVIHVTVPTSTEEIEMKPVVEVRGVDHSVHVHPRRIDEATWAVHWWPREAGWHSVSWRDSAPNGPVLSSGSGDSERDPVVRDPVGLDLFVQSTAAWRVWQHGERHQATLALMASGDSDGGPTGERMRRHTRWPRGWAFAIFLLAAGYLWIDERRPRGRAAER